MILANVPGGLYPLSHRQLNLASPLCKGLTGLLVFDGVRAIDLVRNKFATTVGTSFDAQPQKSPGAVRPTAESSYWKMPVDPVGPTGGYGSIGAVVIPMAGGTFEAIVRDDSAAAGYIPIWASGGNWRSRIDGTDVTGLGTATNGVAYNVCVTMSGVASETNVFIDGTLRAGSVVACGIYANVDWFVNQNANLGSGSLAYFSMFAVWNRALRQDEARSWSANPWQLFAPRRIFIPYLSAAAPAPTLLTASAINITSTSARARVTFTR